MSPTLLIKRGLLVRRRVITNGVNDIENVVYDTDCAWTRRLDQRSSNPRGRNKEITHESPGYRIDR
jgi:hypothetical protein